MLRSAVVDVLSHQILIDCAGIREAPGEFLVIEPEEVLERHDVDLEKEVASKGNLS